MAVSDESVLAPLRAEIDAVDAEIVALLGRRMAVVEQVLAIKRREGIAALLPDRVEEVVRNVRDRAEQKDVPPALAEAVWRAMIGWVVAYEDERLGGRGPSGS